MGGEYAGESTWSDLSPSYLTALEAVVCFPSLQNLILAGIRYLHWTFTYMAKAVKALTLIFVTIKNDLTVGGPPLVCECYSWKRFI
jgi:hypothetical protein